MAEKKQKPVMYTTPAGIAVFPHLNTPDEYEGKKSYKVNLRLTPDEFAVLQQRIDERVDQAWEEMIGKVKPAARKQYTKYYPYEEEYNGKGEDAEPTGNILVKFTKNAEYKDKKTGKLKPMTLGLVDAKRKPMSEDVWGGSTIKVAFFMFPFENAAAKQIGVSLKMQAVQVIDLVTSGGGDYSSMFDEEDGFESSGDTDDNGFEDEDGYEGTDAEDDGSGDF